MEPRATDVTEASGLMSLPSEIRLLILQQVRAQLPTTRELTYCKKNNPKDQVYGFLAEIPSIKYTCRTLHKEFDQVLCPKILLSGLLCAQRDTGMKILGSTQTATHEMQNNEPSILDVERIVIGCQVRSDFNTSSGFLQLARQIHTLNPEWPYIKQLRWCIDIDKDYRTCGNAGRDMIMTREVVLDFTKRSTGYLTWHEEYERSASICTGEILQNLDLWQNSPIDAMTNPIPAKLYVPKASFFQSFRWRICPLALTTAVDLGCLRE